MKKTISILLALAMVFSLCIGMAVTGFAAGETITAEAQGTYTQSAETQDITVRISVNGLSTPYCVFGIGTGTTVPENFTIKSFSTSNTAQAVTAGDYDTANGKFTYITSDVEDTIPGDTYYDVVIEAPANASGTFEIVFNGVEISNQYGANSLVKVNAVTATVTIAPVTPATGDVSFTVAASPATVAPGQDVTVTLKLNTPDVLAAGVLKFAASDGTNSLSISSIEIADGITGRGNKDNGEIAFGNNDGAATNGAVNLAAGTIATVKFSTENASEGTYTVSVTVPEGQNLHSEDNTVLTHNFGTPAQFDVSSAVTLDSIAITTAPTKTVYTAGESFDPNGMVVTATYSDNSTKEVTDYTYPTGALATTDTSVTISYTEEGVTKTADQAITVNEAAVTLESIAITTAPTKTAYTAGESFDPNGMVVTATYSDNSTKEVTDYTYPTGALATTDTSVTISYTEEGVTKTANQTITVTAIGDVNGDGAVDMTDAQRLFNYLVGMDAAGFNVTAADVNGDGTVNSADIVPMLNLISGKTP